MRQTPRILIISSPSGAGKTTLAHMLVAQRARRYEISISHTTRRPRKGEEHGREYYFVSDAGFESMVQTHRFVEHADVHEHRYGTSRDELTRIFGSDRSVLLDIDWQGTERVQWFYPKATSVFILPPSMAELSRRLRGRKTDDDAEIAVRLGNARKELEHYDLYDHLIINDDVDAAFADLDAVAAGRTPPRPAAGLADVERLIAEEVR